MCVNRGPKTCADLPEISYSYPCPRFDSIEYCVCAVCGINQSALADRQSRHLVMTKYKKMK